MTARNAVFRLESVLHDDRKALEVRAAVTSSNITTRDIEAMFGGTTTWSGAQVNERTALQVGTVYACVSRIAGSIASIPKHIYMREGEDQKRADHDYWWMLNEQMTPDFTAVTGWEYILGNSLLNGIGYAELVRPSFSSSRITQIVPRHFDSVLPQRREDGTIYYLVRDQIGEIYPVPSDDILVIPALGFDGMYAVSPIRHAARQAIGIALAAEEHTARFFANGATSNVLLSTESALKPDQVESLRQQYAERVGGARHSGKPLVAQGGMKVERLTLSAVDAELIATLGWSVEEICRIYGVPPHLVGHTEKTTSWGAGVEEQTLGFVKFTLLPWITKVEQEFNRKAWPTRSTYFMECNTAALERGSLKNRFEAYRIAVGRAGEPGWMTADEVRRLERQAPIEGGNTLFKGQNDAQPAPAAAH